MRGGWLQIAFQFYFIYMAKLKTLFFKCKTLFTVSHITKGKVRNCRYKEGDFVDIFNEIEWCAVW